MMSRSFLVGLHRWAGLAMTAFLVIVGLTGSVLAFHAELDAWLNPELLTVTKRKAPVLDPFLLRERAAVYYPDARIDSVQLFIEPGRAVQYAAPPRNDAPAIPATLVYLDPYTGEKIGERAVGEVSLAKEKLVAFTFRLHYSLALPISTGQLGSYILGVTALVWTIDCFVSFYLTFPLRRRMNGAILAKSWSSRWKPAWLIKFTSGAYRINFDIHRAFGLWTWAMLFVFAWSSVGFNLQEAYRPTMNALFGVGDSEIKLPALPMPMETPRLDWRAAGEQGLILLNAEAHRHGFAIERAELLRLDRQHGAYIMYARSSLDIGKYSQTYVLFDADTGALRQALWPGHSSEKTGDVISRWLSLLHMAAVFGLPMQIFVCVISLVITALSITGVYIWWKKRTARKSRERRKPQRRFIVAD